MKHYSKFMEALTAKQKKIDHNKNGRIDGDDLKKLRNESDCTCDCGKSPCVECGEDHHDMEEGYVPSADKKPSKDGRMLPAKHIQTKSPDKKDKEMSEGVRRFKSILAEKLDLKKAKMGDVIKDFQDSDAPQFKGKSDKKKREMAIAAKLQADDEKKESLDLSMRNAGPMKNIFGKSKAEIEKQKADALKKNADKPKKEEVSEAVKQEGITGAIAGGVLGGMAGGPVGAAAGAYLGHKVQKAASKPKKEEMTPAQKAARLQMIKKAAAKMNKRAEMDAKRAMRKDPDLRKPKKDPADHDLVHKEEVIAERDKANALKRKTMDAARGARYKLNNPVPDREPEHKTNQQHNKAIGRALRNEATPNKKQVKQAIGIARDKRYAGGNMTGATKAMDKINKGLAQHPAVAKELQKQNESLDPAGSDLYNEDKKSYTDFINTIRN